LSQELIAYNVYAVATIVVAFVVGSLSQYVGRRRMLIIVAIASIITWLPTNYGIVMFGFSLNLISVMLLAVWYAVLDHATFSVMDPYLTERFGTSHRASGTGISYALGSMVGGICAAALVPVLHAALAGIETSTSVWLTVGIVGVTGSLIGLIGVYIGPETIGAKLEEIEYEPSSSSSNNK
jgi:MFS family permease